jgi:glucose/arabinose dehydrogenase
MRRLYLTLPALFLLNLCIGQPTLPEGFIAQQIISGINPVAMDFDPNERLFITELTGNILLVENDLVLDEPVAIIPVDNTGERGLYGIAFDPDFKFNHYIYIYYSVQNENHNRLSRFILHDNHIHYAQEEVLIDFDYTTAVIHNGGDIKFGPDGKLYIAVGDGGTPTLAQSQNSLFGKILRINSDGSVPTDNPFYSTNQGIYKSIYAYGLRNPFTFDFNANTLFASDVGQSDYEEINNILPGKNYGWPLVEGKLSNSGAAAPENYIDPVYVYSHSIGCAITGASFYDPQVSIFPEEFKNKYFFGDYCNNTIKVLDPTTQTADLFLENGSGPTFIKTSPSGEMYIGSFGGGNQGSIWKIMYSTDGSPRISLQPKSAIASVNETVVFSIIATGNAPLAYQWMKNGLLLPDATSNSLQISNVTLADNGATFSCIVQNGKGQVESNVVILTVTSRTRPQSFIDMSVNSSLYTAGDTIIVRGAASDEVEGTLPKSALSWRVDFHHDHHSHPILTDIHGTDSISFVVPRVGETSSNVWYRVYIEAENDAGLSQSSYTEIFPLLSTITIKTTLGDNASYPVFLDGALQMTPFTVTGVAGMTRNISIVPNQIVGDYLYQTDSKASVTLNIPTKDTVLLFTGNFNKIYFGNGSGLSGQYYDGALNFKGTPSATRIDSRLDFNWGYQAPVSNLNGDYFSIVWKGYLHTPTDNLYTFYLNSDDGIKLWIDDEVLVDNLQNAPEDELTVSKVLASGIHPIKIYYYEDAGAASISFSWSSSELPKGIIPHNVLYNKYYKPMAIFTKEQDTFYPGQTIEFTARVADWQMQPVKKPTTQWELFLINPNDTIHLSTINNIDSMIYTIPDHLNYSKESYLLLHFIGRDIIGFADTLSKKIEYLNETYFSSQAEIAVHPNPSTHTLTIESNGAEILDYVVLYNNMGQPMLSKNLSSASGSKIQVNISGLPPGLYIAKVSIGKSHFLTKITKL